MTHFKVDHSKKKKIRLVKDFITGHLPSEPLPCHIIKIKLFKQTVTFFPPPPLCDFKVTSMEKKSAYRIVQIQDQTAHSVQSDLGSTLSEKRRKKVASRSQRG